MSHLLALLNEIRDHRVAMYVGATSLTKLADYLRGYHYAIARLRPNETDTFLTDFRDWLYQRFQTNANLSWESVILQQSATEADAIRRFWELLDEYLQQRDGGSNVARVPVNDAAQGNTQSAERQPHS